MAVTVISTPGDPAANSFASVAEADLYFDERLHSASWSDLDADDKARALIMASRSLSALKCEKTLTTGGIVALSTHSTTLKIATFELAFLFSNADPMAQSDALNEGLKRVKAGAVEVEFKDGFTGRQVVPDTIRALLPDDWLCPDGTGLIFEVV